MQRSGARTCEQTGNKRPLESRNKYHSGLYSPVQVNGDTRQNKSPWGRFFLSRLENCGIPG